MSQEKTEEMMKRETSPLIKQQLSFDKQNPVYTKLVILFLLLGTTVFLFSSHSIDFSPQFLQNETTPAAVLDSQETHIVVPTSDKSDGVLENRSFPEVDSQEAETDLFLSDKGSASSKSTESNNDEAKGKCDLFRGDWVPNPSGPAYNNNTCQNFEGHQNCMKNGRPDTGYLFWKWKPNDCELPKFNPQRFLELMRNKYFGFVGDSIARNHVQSMICILSQVEQPKQIYHDEEYKTRISIFLSYNFTVATIWAPFLLKAETFEDSNGVTTADIKLHLDKLEEDWTKRYHNFDYMMISGGKWYWKTTIYYENSTIQGCHYCSGKNLTEINVDVVYRKALNLVYNFITSSTHKPRVLFRTITPSHFEGGDWHNGGSCRRKVPFKENEVDFTGVDKILYDIQVEEFNRAVSKASENGVEMKLFDTTGLSLLRPDGHPDAYRQFQPFAKDANATVQRDCLHWCLPGPIDSWNDLLMEILMNT